MPSVLIAARHLVDRLRQPRSRAEELRQLRQRLQEAPTSLPAAERAAALRLRALRERLSQLVGPVESCRTCAKGHPPPHGHFDGGHCCGLRTEDAFNDDEVAALRLAGTTPGRLTPPAGGPDHAGCAFRGPTGCSLAVPDRPNLCLRYLCPDLTRELHRRDPERLAVIDAVNAELEAEYLAFIKLRADRLEDEALGIAS